MILERIYTDGLAQVAWLVGDTESGEAAVIDPRRDPQIYIDIAEKYGLKVVATLETHIHADFVSGVLELRKMTGAEIYASGLGDLGFDHIPLNEGDEISVGSVRLRAMHTPGHTPEHLSFLLFDGPDAAEPTGIFTGDALFVGEVGRPDLLGEDQKEQLIRQLYETVTERFSALPDHLVVYPGHGAGSACGRNIGSEPTTTIGQERLGNYAFKQRSLDEFRDAVMTNMPPAPAYYPVLKRINAEGAPPPEHFQAGGAVSAETIEEVLKNDGIVIDTRTHNDFAEGHIPGTISIGGGSSFVDWVGWLAPYDQPVYLVLGSPDEYDDVKLDLYRIGVDNVGGYLEDGVDGWTRSGRQLESYGVMTVDDLREALQERDDVQVVDVRAPDEWSMGHIEGAIHEYVGPLISEGDSLPSDKTLAFICGSGYRANIAASVAARRGYESIINVDGGMQEWNKQGYPVESDDT